MATLERSGGKALAHILMGCEEIQAAGIVLNHLGKRSDGDLDAASVVDGRGKPAVIQCDNGQTVTKCFEQDSGRSVANTGDTENMADSHDTKNLFPFYTSIEGYPIFHPQPTGQPFPRSHARALTENMQLHLLLTKRQSTDEKIECLARDKISRPANAQGGSFLVANATLHRVRERRILQTDLAHKVRIAAPKTANGLHAVFRADKNSGSRAYRRPSVPPPSFVHGIDERPRKSVAVCWSFSWLSATAKTRGQCSYEAVSL